MERHTTNSFSRLKTDGVLVQAGYCSMSVELTQRSLFWNTSHCAFYQPRMTPHRYTCIRKQSDYGKISLPKRYTRGLTFRLESFGFVIIANFNGKQSKLIVKLLRMQISDVRNRVSDSGSIKGLIFLKVLSQNSLSGLGICSRRTVMAWWLRKISRFAVEPSARPPTSKLTPASCLDRYIDLSFDWKSVEDRTTYCRYQCCEELLLVRADACCRASTKATVMVAVLWWQC